MDQSRNDVLPPAAYVNFLRVAHQKSEFFLTFGQLAQGRSAGAHLVASLVTSPAQAKSMLGALAEAIDRYEKSFGEIAAAGPAAALPEGQQPGAAAPRGDGGAFATREPRAKRA